MSRKRSKCKLISGPSDTRIYDAYCSKWMFTLIVINLYNSYSWVCFLSRVYVLYPRIRSDSRWKIHKVDYKIVSLILIKHVWLIFRELMFTIRDVKDWRKIKSFGVELTHLFIKIKNNIIVFLQFFLLIRK